MQPAPPPPKTMVLCADVSHRYAHQRLPALSSVTMELKRGEFFALIGPHAGGKSTLAQLIAGLLLPTSGQITVDDIDTRYNLPPLPAFVSYLSQAPEALDHVSLQQLLFLAGALRNMPPAESRQAARDLLERCDLAPLARRPLGQLAAGQRQLARFCAALMGYPRLLVLDEPTTGMEPIQRRWVWDLLKLLHQQTGITTVVVTHDLDAIDHIVDRVGFLRAGQLVAVGTPATLKEHYGNGPRLEVRLAVGEQLLASVQQRLKGLGELVITDDSAGFILYPSAETLGQLARSVPMPSAPPTAAPPAKAAKATKGGRGKGRAATNVTTAVAVAEPANDTWLLDRQMPVPGTLGRTIEAIFAIVGPERIAECWFAPPSLDDVYARLGAMEP